jgi:uncharacterized protein
MTEQPAALRGLDLLLLDVNVLLALAWPNHQFHSAATRRLGRTGQRWATCALTQLGFIRLSSNPAITGGAVRPGEAASLLARMVADPLHVYLPLSPPVEAAEAFEKILGYRQVTDAYLAAVAREHNARLLTFDTRARDLGNAEVLS